jgi:hypothetical protein
LSLLSRTVRSRNTTDAAGRREQIKSFGVSSEPLYEGGSSLIQGEGAERVPLYMRPHNIYHLPIINNS